MTRLSPMIRIRIFIRTRIPPLIITRLQPRSVKRTTLPPMRRRLEPLPASSSFVKGTAGPQIRRRLDVEHLVVPPQLGRTPLHVEIEGRARERGDEGRDGEGGEGLVEAADHDARVVVPG